MRFRLPLIGILLVYLTIGSLYATLTPPWQIPDEPAHYNYIRHLVDQRSFPVLQVGDYPFAYLEQLKAERFPPELSIDSVRYEAWQPPLYYLLAAPVFALTNGSLIAIRLFTLIIGSFVIILTYFVGRTLFPVTPTLALLAAGFIAFVPQHIAMMAAANNDALAEVIIALGLLLALRAVMSPPSPLDRPPTRAYPQARSATTWLICGVVLGLAFLTKLSAYPLVALFTVAILLTARRERWSVKQVAQAAAQLYLPALLIGGLWWARNLTVYGGLDFLAMSRHNLVVQDQPRAADIFALWGLRTYVNNFFQTTFQSFWGQFGWMGVVMDQRIYLALLAYTIVLIVAWGGAIIARRQSVPPLLSGPSARSVRRAQERGPGGEALGWAPFRDALVLLAVHALLTLAVYLYYNLSFVQFQGRYLYSSLPLVALASAVALQQWATWLTRYVPLSLRPTASAFITVGPLLLMAVLAIYALYTFIIPQLTYLPA